MSTQQNGVRTIKISLLIFALLIEGNSGVKVSSRLLFGVGRVQKIDESVKAPLVPLVEERTSLRGSFL